MSDANVTVEPTDAGLRLDAFLAARFPQFSRVRLQEMIRTAAVLVDATPRKNSYRLRVGETVSLVFPAPFPTGPLPEDIPLDVLYADDELVAINKAHGMVVHPAKGHWAGTLTSALAFHFGEMSQAGGASRPGIVHRLDRDTSGVIVVARTDRTHLALAKQFEQRTVEKEYFAICRGKLDRDRDRIEQPIGIHPYHRERMAIRGGHSTSREASTFYEVQERFRGFLSLRVFPKTGRTHQIRVHLMHVGCPVLCDPLYAGHRELTLGELQGQRPGGPVVLDRLALHARRLELTHPTTGQRLRLEAPLPADLVQLVGLLRKHST